MWPLRLTASEAGARRLKRQVDAMASVVPGLSLGQMHVPSGSQTTRMPSIGTSLPRCYLARLRLRYSPLNNDVECVFDRWAIQYERGRSDRQATWLEQG